MGGRGNYTTPGDASLNLHVVSGDVCRENPEAPPPLFCLYFCLVLRMAEARIPMDGAYAHLAACYKRTTHHCIAELNGCLSPGTWLKSSCRAGRFFQESLSQLKSFLWKSADIMRGSIDASEFKNYFFGML